jgi:hypothetical protein
MVKLTGLEYHTQLSRITEQRTLASSSILSLNDSRVDDSFQYYCVDNHTAESLPH